MKFGIRTGHVIPDKEYQTMKFGKGIIALVAAFMLLVGSGAAALAQEQSSDTGDATVEITINATNNFLAVSVTDVNFLQWAYSFDDRDVNGDLFVEVTDTRGTGAGWNVLLSATDFVRADLAYSFAIDNLDLLQNDVTDLAYLGTPAISPSPSCIAPDDAVPVNGTGTKILSAAVNCGMGQFQLEMNGTLTIPGGTLAGVYQSIVTVDIATGP
jgi:hypothetical protein